MNIAKVDLNLLVYLDVLLREGSVTKAANQLSITQPAMSNGLRRLRDLFKDPLLVRTSDGMTPTKRALELKPVIRDVLSKLETTIQPETEFNPELSERTFRIMASDYAESTLLMEVISKLSKQAPNVTLDLITPSDVTFHDVEQGRVDMAINRFDELPLSFHQKVIWYDTFSCVVNSDNPIIENFTLEQYLANKHIWVSKTGFGVGVGVNPNEVQKLGWVDEELTKILQNDFAVWIDGAALTGKSRAVLEALKGMKNGLLVLPDLQNLQAEMSLPPVIEGKKTVIYFDNLLSYYKNYPHQTWMVNRFLSQLLAAKMCKLW